MATSSLQSPAEKLTIWVKKAVSEEMIWQSNPSIV